MKIKLYVAVTALVLLPTPSAADAATPTEWPQPGQGPGNTYYNPAESRLNAATIGQIKQRWTLNTRSSSCDVGVQPVLDSTRLYSNDPGGIGAYDPKSGTRRWHQTLPNTTVTTLALADGKLLMLSSVCRTSGEFESHLTAFRPDSGQRLWTTGLRKFTYDLRVDRGVAVLDSNQAGTPSTIAYGVADGKFRWLRKGDRGEGLVSAGGRLLLRRASGGAVAVRVTDGHELWSTKRNWYAAGTDPAGTHFYISGDSGLSAVDAATGRLVWSTKLPISTVSADGRHVFYSQYRSSVSLDAKTGRKLYSVHTMAAAGRPVRAGGLLYTPTGYGSALSITDAADGRTRPVMTTIASDANHPPVVAGGQLYVTEDGVLRAYF